MTDSLTHNVSLWMSRHARHWDPTVKNLFEAKFLLITSYAVRQQIRPKHIGIFAHFLFCFPLNLLTAIDNKFIRSKTTRICLGLVIFHNRPHKSYLEQLIYWLKLVHSNCSNLIPHSSIPVHVFLYEYHLCFIWIWNMSNLRKILYYLYIYIYIYYI